MSARPPLDYSLAAETPAGHLRNALQLVREAAENLAVRGDPGAHHVSTDAAQTLYAARKRIEAALALLEPQS